MWGRLSIGGRLATCLIKGAGPGELFGSGCDSGMDRIHFNVAGNSRKLRFAANKPIVAFILPERLPGEPQDAVAFFGSESLEGLHHFGEIDQRRDHQMNMVWHHDIGVEPVLLQIAVMNSIDNHTGNIGLAKRQRAGARLIEQTVQGNEGLSGCGRSGKFAIRRKAAVKTPGNKNGSSNGTIVGQPASVKRSHKVKVSLLGKGSWKHWADCQSAAGFQPAPQGLR
jgi:hypothetical protein